MKQFKAESKRLLDLMINSIYTHKEIFLRELISNASDALDKLYFLSLTDDTVGKTRDDFEIRVIPNKETRTLTISDNGIGMDKAALEENLGVIAKSGSLNFRKENAGAQDIDIIGQFGVGFYSAFMVASKLTVISRAFGSDTAWKWESKGADGYTVTQAEKDTVGTDIILVIKDDNEEEHYSEFLEEYRLEGLIKKYSDYVRYPVKMNLTKSRKVEDAKEGEEEYESYVEQETINSMVPIWKRNKSEVSAEDYAAFYKEKFMDFSDPAKVIQSKTEGTATYNALLFIPSRPPYDYYTKDFEKGLQLYASGVLIMEKCSDLLPDHFSFVKGLVDSQDLSLNISREMLQHDGQLRLIRTSLERKIRAELASWLANEREQYEAFFKNFGIQLKVGAYASYGAEADNLKDLLLFHSAAEDKMVTLAEYVEKMPEDQKYIYYAAGDSTDRLAKLPQAELVRGKGYDLLLLTDDVDEFVMQILRQYGEKEMRNISGGDLGLETEAEKEEVEKQNEENKDLFAAMKQTLNGKVTNVKASGRLKNHPVIITASGGLSLEMEKVLNSMPTGEKVESEKVLEINAEHPVFAKLQALFAAGDAEKERLGKYTHILYDQALLIEGMPIADPVAYTQLVCELLADE
ncbi:molecular chaperone HtpG [Ruminococcaceae bacterium OttesenSCG-928-A16]|nr:molecular chaperone HtpG [Ruminococcaceae bacterium OttesenSCG-928-A16]